MTKKYVLVALVAASVMAGGSLALAGPHGGPGACWNGPAAMEDGPAGGPGWRHHPDFRGPHHWGGGYGPHHWGAPGACWGYAQLTPEKQVAFDKIVDEIQPRLDELRMQFRVKHMELNALSRNPNTTRDDIHKAADELQQLGTAINKERQAMYTRLEKEVGPLPCNGPRFGFGPRFGDGPRYGGGPRFGDGPRFDGDPRFDDRPYRGGGQWNR